MVVGTLYGWTATSYNEYRLNKTQIAAKYAGVDIKVVKLDRNNRPADFLAKFPLSKTPAFESSTGLLLAESNAIAHYVSTGSALLGNGKDEHAEILSVMNMCDSELNSVTIAWLNPIFGFSPFNAETTENAKANFNRVLTFLDDKLSGKTFLVGDHVTLADIVLVATLAPFFTTVLDAEYASQFKHVTRWFTTCINQPNFKVILGDFVFCKKQLHAGTASLAAVSASASVAFGKIHRFKVTPVDRTLQSVIAAKYNNLNLEISEPTDVKDPAFLAKFPMGKVPAFEGPNGFLLSESNAIARYIASGVEDTTLFGEGKKHAALVESYILLSEEFFRAQASLLYYVWGFGEKIDSAIASTKTNVVRHLTYLNTQLATRTFLVGDRVTLADIIMVSALLNLFKLVLEPTMISELKNVTRWFTTCINQPHFKSVIGEFKFCVKAAVPADFKKDAKPVTKVEDVKAKPVAAKKEKAPKEKKEKKEPVEDLEAIAAAELSAKAKEKNPLDLLPKSSFVLDEWKRFYSNNETRPTAVDWFWQNFDPTGYSVYKVDYKYNSELTQVFMSSNLIGGFFQRLDSARKYAFGSMLVLGVDGKNQVTGYFVVRGSTLPFEITDSPGVESFSFVKVDDKSKAVRDDVNAVFAWDEKIRGLACADGKVFK